MGYTSRAVILWGFRERTNDFNILSMILCCLELPTMHNESLDVFK